MNRCARGRQPGKTQIFSDSVYNQKKGEREGAVAAGTSRIAADPAQTDGGTEAEGGLDMAGEDQRNNCQFV